MSLNKALAISLLYKYGMFKRADEDQVNIRQHASGGAGLGSLIGGGLGMAKKYKNMSKLEAEKINPPPQMSNKIPTNAEEGKVAITEVLKRLEHEDKLNAFDKLHPAGSFSRLKQVVKKFGFGKTFKSAIKTGLVVGGAGALIGAGIGTGVGYARKKINERNK